MSTRTSAIGRRYGRALLELARESGRIPALGEELNQLAAAWDQSTELREVFSNPAFDATARNKVVDALATRLRLSETAKNAFRLLADRRRLGHLTEIAEAYQTAAEAEAEQVRAVVTTAGAMPAGYFEAIQQALQSTTGKQVVVVQRQDPELIAGVVTQVGDKVFDGSLKSRLNELKEELLAS